MIGAATAAVYAQGLLPQNGPGQLSQALVNRTEWAVTFNFAFPSEGEPVWRTYTLQPCEEHHWTADHDPERAITLTWPMWFDHRVDEHGNVIMTGTGIPLSSDGYAAFFAVGEQVWIDTSGGAEPCSAE